MCRTARYVVMIVAMVRGRLAPHDLLERDHVRPRLLDDARHTRDRPAPVDSDALVNVVGDDP